MARSSFTVIGAFLQVFVVLAVQAAGQQVVLGQGLDGPVAVAGCHDATPDVPDPMIAVGPEHIVATVNSRLYVWRKGPPWSLPLQFQLKEIFGLNCPDARDYYDPRCVYDHYPAGDPWWGQRFVLMAIDAQGTPPPSNPHGTIHLAVSWGSDPTVVPWDAYEVENDCWDIDFSWLGYDALNDYATTNKFGAGYALIRSFRKSDLSSGEW